MESATRAAPASTSTPKTLTKNPALIEQTCRALETDLKTTPNKMEFDEERMRQLTCLR